MKKLLIGIIGLLFYTSCSHNNTLESIDLQSPQACSILKRKIKWENPIPSLNAISLMYKGKCYDETISAVDRAKENLGSKTFSVTRETLELFIPEGALTEYVLESYERGFLTFLAAASFKNLNDRTGVTVELNRLYNEETALTYNHGQDSVNALIQAAMWENHMQPGFSSRPFWSWLSKRKDVADSIKTFALERLNQIDNKVIAPIWYISEVGRMPKVDWSLNFVDANSGYFTFKPTQPFLDSCATPKSILVNTSTWFNKIAIRHANSYHPLVNAKSWIRAPFGIAYGISTVAAGAGLAVGGCAIDASVKNGGSLCKVSLKHGIAAMGKSKDVIEYTLQPDLRHWEYVPEAILISSESKLEEGDCLKQLANKEITRLL